MRENSCYSGGDRAGLSEKQHLGLFFHFSAGAGTTAAKWNHQSLASVDAVVLTQQSPLRLP